MGDDHHDAGLLKRAIHAGEALVQREEELVREAVRNGEKVEHQLVERLEGIQEGRPVELFREAVPGETGFVDGAQGQQIFWHEVGPDVPSGPQFLFVHGLGLSHEVWRFQQDALRRHHRVVSIDLRGHGKSDVSERPLTVSEGAAIDLANVLEARDMHDAVIVGHSLGGMSSIQFALDRPDVVNDRVVGLVGLSTSGSGRNLLSSRLIGPFRSAMKLFDQTVLGEGIKKIVGLRKTPITDSDVGLFAFREMFGANAEEGAVEFSRELVDDFTPEGMAESLDAIFHFEVLDKVHEIEPKMMIVHGTRDLLLPQEEAELLAERLPRSVLVRAPHAGHMIMYESSDWLTELLESFAHGLTEVH